MKYMHNIIITTFVKPEDDKNIAIKSILKFLPEDLKKEKIQIEENHLKHEHGDEIIKFVVRVDKERHTKLILKKIKEILSEKDLKKLVEEENRVDETGTFYLRLDKKKIEEEQIAELTDKGNCLHFKIKIACYPKTREKAILVVKEMFSK